MSNQPWSQRLVRLQVVCCNTTCKYSWLNFNTHCRRRQCTTHTHTHLVTHSLTPPGNFFRVSSSPQYKSLMSFPNVENRLIDLYPYHRELVERELSALQTKLAPMNDAFFEQFIELLRDSRELPDNEMFQKSECRDCSQVLSRR